MGVCAYRLRKPDAAARQWRRLIEEFPDTEWAAQATSALAAVASTDSLTSEAGRPAPELPDEMPTQLVRRHHLAAQLMDCELPLVAIKEYLKVIHVLTAGRPNPLQEEAAYQVGVCHHLCGRPDLALAAWERMVAAYPDTEWAAKARVAIEQSQQREEAMRKGIGDRTG
jgi:hypothetical protein